MNNLLSVVVHPAKTLTEALKEKLFKLYHTQVLEEFGKVEHLIPEDLKSDLKKSTLELMDNTETYLVAFQGEEVIGFLSTDYGTPTRVQALYVDEKHRLKGVGSALLKTLSKRLDHNAIDLYCLKENEGAMVFYLKHGFVFDKGSAIMTHGVGIIH